MRIPKDLPNLTPQETTKKTNKVPPHSEDSTISSVEQNIIPNENNKVASAPKSLVSRVKKSKSNEKIKYLSDEKANSLHNKLNKLSGKDKDLEKEVNFELSTKQAKLSSRVMSKERAAKLQEELKEDVNFDF